VFSSCGYANKTRGSSMNWLWVIVWIGCVVLYDLKTFEVWNRVVKVDVVKKNSEGELYLSLVYM
jgi:hypothetical protein